MYNAPMKLLLICLGLASLLASANCSALSSDREKSIHIQADSAVVDDKLGLSTYKGNVVVNQGTLHITADEVQITSKNNEVVKVVASTAPNSKHLAHYQQLPDNSKQLVKADARKITWLVKKRQLELDGEAHLRQSKDSSFSGAVIHYDAGTGTVNARSNKNAPVETIFKPKPRK